METKNDARSMMNWHNGGNIPIRRFDDAIDRMIEKVRDIEDECEPLRIQREIEKQQNEAA